jgi:hypothetical protein
MKLHQYKFFPTLMMFSCRVNAQPHCTTLKRPTSQRPWHRPRPSPPRHQGRIDPSLNLNDDLGGSACNCERPQIPLYQFDLLFDFASSLRGDLSAVRCMSLLFMEFFPRFVREKTQM